MKHLVWVPLSMTGKSAQAYALGYLPPRYPLPAIIYHVYLPGENPMVQVWEHSRFEIEPYITTYNRLVRVYRCGQ